MTASDPKAQGYDDAKSYRGDSNPYPRGSVQWAAYREGFAEYLAEYARLCGRS